MSIHDAYSGRPQCRELQCGSQQTPACSIMQKVLTLAPPQPQPSLAWIAVSRPPAQPLRRHYAMIGPAAVTGPETLFASGSRRADQETPCVRS